MTLFKVRSDLHIARKLWHSIALLLILVVYQNLDRQNALKVVTIGSLLFVVVDLIRLRVSWINEKVMTIFKPFMREHERTSIAGTTSMAISLAIIMYIFPKSVVKLTILFVAVADPMASYIGLKYGKDRIIGKKTLQGTIGAFFTCFAIAFLYYYSEKILVGHLLIASLLSGLIGALGELIPFGRLDDNFTFPIFSAFCLYGLFSLYGVIA